MNTKYLERLLRTGELARAAVERERLRTLEQLADAEAGTTSSQGLPVLVSVPLHDSQNVLPNEVRILTPSHPTLPCEHSVRVRVMRTPVM